MKPTDNDIPPLDPMLLAALNDLPDGIAPSSDLWKGIESRLDEGNGASEAQETRNSIQWQPLLVAAGIALTLVGAWSLRNVGEAAPSEAAPVVSVNTAGEWGHELKQANASLQRQLDARDDLSPEAREAIDRNLETIDQAIRDVQKALDAKPDDPALRRWLTDTHSLKQQVLVSALHLPEGA